MTEQQPQESKLELLQREYFQVCAKAGDVAYRIKCFEGDLHAHNKRLFEINQEVAALQEAEKAKPTVAEVV